MKTAVVGMGVPATAALCNELNFYLCAFILLPFSRFRGSCSYYIKVLAIPQIFLDTTAGSVWIVLFLSFLDYIYLAISCLMPCDFTDV